SPRGRHFKEGLSSGEQLLSGNSSVGRARPCQGRGREFESRFPLQNSCYLVRMCDPLLRQIYVPFVYWPRTPPFHGGNRGSSPQGDATPGRISTNPSRVFQ